MRYLFEDEAEFYPLYLESIGNKPFSLANFNTDRPYLGLLLVDDDKVVGIVAAHLYDTIRLGNDVRRIIIPVWGFVKGYSNEHALKSVNLLIERMPYGTAAIAYCMNHANSIFQASLNMAKKLGFKVIDENEYCTIIKYEKAAKVGE